MKLFVSGPMTGIKHLNTPMFALVSGALVDLGHSAFFPPHDVRQDQEYAACLRECLDWLCREAEGIVSLPGWPASPGATAEAATAWALGIPHWEARTEGDGSFLFLPHGGKRNPATGPLLRKTGQPRGALDKRPPPSLRVTPCRLTTTMPESARAPIPTPTGRRGRSACLTSPRPRPVPSWRIPIRATRAIPRPGCTRRRSCGSRASGRTASRPAAR